MVNCNGKSATPNSQLPPWEVHVPSSALTDGSIHVFSFIFTPGLADTPARADSLSDEEILRAEKFYHTIDRNRFVIGRSILRTILGRLLDKAPKDIAIQLQNGRPMLSSDTNPSINFNISHGGDSVMVALVYGGPVGIDVEPYREFSDIDSVSKRVMTASEYEHYLSLPSQCRAEAFCRLWVRKESLLKCLGTGFQIEPNRISVGHLAQRETEARYQQGRYLLTQNMMTISRREHYWAVAYHHGATPKAIAVHKVEYVLT